MSRIVLESTPDATENAIRDGTFALITPVMTLTDGRWVAMTRWIPAARASCARRQIASSTSLEATIIRSASSSIMITSCGSFFGIWSAGTSPLSMIVCTFALYPFKSRTFEDANLL